MSNETIPGFDYTTHKPVAHTRQEWRNLYPPWTHTRRVENGETFYSHLKGALAAEVYANIPA